MKRIAVVLICALGALLAAAPTAFAHTSNKAGCRHHRRHHRHAHCVRHGRNMASGKHHAHGAVQAVATNVPTGSTPIHCDLYAAPSGSDASGDGSIGNPYQTVVKLDNALAPGQTGCLRAGTYGSVHTLHELSNSGNSSGRITISSYPGETATVVGWVDIEAGYTTLSHLKIDGSNTFYQQERDGTNCPYPVSQGLVIAGPNDVFEYNDYYQSDPSLRGNGLGIGWWGDADNTVVRFNKIHDVGQCQAYDHLIYLSHGNNVQIYGNWMWNDPHGRGVQLYPDPTNARVFDNVIDHAGEGFVVGDEAGDEVSGNQIYNNIVSNSEGLPWEGIQGDAIHDLYGGPAGSGNSFDDNVLYDNPGGLGSLSAVSSSGNVTANPMFVDAASHNYQVQSGSPASGWSLWSGSGAA